MAAARDVPQKLNKNRDMKSRAPLDLITKNQDQDPEATVRAPVETATATERTITVVRVADLRLVAIEKEALALGKIGIPEEIGDHLTTIESINLVITIMTEEIPTDPLTIIRVEIIITPIEITIEEVVAIEPMKIVASVAEIIDTLLAEPKAATKQIIIAEIMMAGIETIKIDILLVTI
jgi:hypothetical protein